MEHEHTLETQLSARLPASLQVLCFDTLPSTNTYLKELSRSGEIRDTLCLALTQTAGRGRLGRTFDSQPAMGLYLSMLLHPRISPQQSLPATGLAAVAALEALEQVSGLQAEIKWMNDLVYNKKKLCGILAELDLSPAGELRGLILGVGVNLHQKREDFPPPLQDMATSLAMEDHPASLPDLAAVLGERLLRLPALLETGDYGSMPETYRRRCLTLGKEVLLVKNGVSTPARALDIDPAFGLLVEYPDGTVATVTMGEVSVRGLYGYTS